MFCGDRFDRVKRRVISSMKKRNMVRIFETMRSRNIRDFSRRCIAGDRWGRAALVILERVGASGPFDALARESGFSKGGLLHQFRTKNGVLEASAEYQSQHFQRVAPVFSDACVQ
jgi:hypothetical protein